MFNEARLYLYSLSQHQRRRRRHYLPIVYTGWDEPPEAREPGVRIPTQPPSPCPILGIPWSQLAKHNYCKFLSLYQLQKRIYLPTNKVTPI